MDTRDLTQALRDATEGLEPRTGFADAVVTGARRRRTRNRITVATAIAGTAAVAAAVVMAGPSPLSSPPPPGASTVVPTPKEDWRMRHIAGDRADDAFFTTEALETWHTGLRHDERANWNGRFDDRPGDPHVYWAGETPYGDAAIVLERVRLGPDDERLLTGVVSTRRGSGEFRLLAVQVDDPGTAGHFLLPDNRTILTVAHPDDGLWVSPEILYTDHGSRRDWTPVPVHDGVGIVQLPEGTNPANLRLVAGDPDTPPDREVAKPGGHLPITQANPLQPARRGLPWNSAAWAGDLPNFDLPTDPFSSTAQFSQALRDSGLLDPFSYREEPSPWLVTTALRDGRIVIVGEEQELDHPAYLYAVTLGRHGGEPVVERLYEVDPSAALPVVHRLPDDHGWLVVAFQKPLSYRTSPTSAWTEPETDAAVLPPAATQVLVGGQVVNLP